MFNQNNQNPSFEQLKYFIQAGMFQEAIAAYSKLREIAEKNFELISNESIQKEFRENESILIGWVREQIKEIYQFTGRRNTEYAFTRGMSLLEILDIESTRRYFSQ
jgi:hypothetical protein